MYIYILIYKLNSIIPYIEVYANERMFGKNVKSDKS